MCPGNHIISDGNVNASLTRSDMTASESTVSDATNATFAEEHLTRVLTRNDTFPNREQDVPQNFITSTVETSTSGWDFDTHNESAGCVSLNIPSDLKPTEIVILAKAAYCMLAYTLPSGVMILDWVAVLACWEKEGVDPRDSFLRQVLVLEPPTTCMAETAGVDTIEETEVNTHS